MKNQNMIKADFSCRGLKKNLDSFLLPLMVRINADHPLKSLSDCPLKSVTVSFEVINGGRHYPGYENRRGGGWLLICR